MNSLENPAHSALRTHIALMHRQREELGRQLSTLPGEMLWKQPEPHEWSVGENLDHMVVIYRSFFSLVQLTYSIGMPLARLRRKRPFQTDIDDVYHRPGFPQNVGWMWPPRHSPRKPTTLDALMADMKATHDHVERIYTTKDPNLLGRITVWDPAIGSLNLIQVLRVGIYHDALHVDQINKTLRQIGAGAWASN